MPKHALRGSIILLAALFLYGCTATKDVEMRHYVEVKDRVDQNMEGGNAGFVGGTPQPVDRSDIRKTRKTYVLEFSKKTDAEMDETLAQDAAPMDEPRYEDYQEEAYPDEGMGYVEPTSRRAGSQYQMPDLDDIDVVDDATAPAPTFKPYTVQKDDTLQKISKKFYNSYSKWPRIYEANKAVIDNPDFIKPGTELQIPMD